MIWLCPHEVAGCGFLKRRPGDIPASLHGESDEVCRSPLNAVIRPSAIVDRRKKRGKEARYAPWRHTAD